MKMKESRQLLQNYFKTDCLQNECALARDGWHDLVFQKHLGEINALFVFK